MLLKIYNQIGSIFKSFNNLQIVYPDPNKGAYFIISVKNTLTESLFSLLASSRGVAPHRSLTYRG